MRTISGVFCLGLLLGFGCTRSSGDADAPTTGEVAAETKVAPVEAQPTDPETPAVDPSLCVPASYEEWSTCEGKRIQVDGRKPEMVGQHPMVNGPESEQSYLDVEGGGQIILVTSQPVTCQGEMRVVGTLRGVDLGGDPGTKDSYAGWSLQDADVTCR